MLVVSECLSSKNVLTLRTYMDDKDDAKSFIRKFGKFDDSHWIQGNRLNKGNSSRFVMHNKWVCSFSSHRKVESSKKNQKCDAFIDILIKIVTKGSKKNDEYLKRDPPLNTVIKINPFHSHNCGSADALKRLFIDPEVKSVFLKYFADGLSPSQAMKQNISRLRTLPNYIVSLANGALNPRPWTIYRLWHKYLEENYGSFKEPFERLEEKIPDYLNQGIHVVMDKTDPWVVLVVTPLNERAQKLKNSSEIIFMDSTSSCDVSMASVTVLLTATKGGAVPIGVLIHKQQTAVAYEKGFKMLMDNFPLCFNGLTYPKIIMTDDSMAEKKAIQEIWPQTTQILCIFHFLQAEWRWLMSSSSNILPVNRQQLMQLFRKAVYAKNHEDFQDVVNEINHLEGNQSFKDRFNENLKRSQEWSMSYRNENLITRNNQTNNYSEATIRILKEIILERTKAYNVVALVEFISIIWDKYFINRLLDFAYNRRNQKDYELQLTKMKSVDPNSILQIDEFLYKVPSSKDSKKFYDVNTIIGWCSCYSGKQGGFCKHQALLKQYYDIEFPNSPVTDSNERHKLALLTLGIRDCPPKPFYEDLNELPTPQTSIMEKENLKTTREKTNLQLCYKDFSNNLQDGDIENDPNIRPSIPLNNNQSLNDKFTEKWEDFTNSINRLGELLQQDVSETSIRHLSVFTKKIKNIDTTSQAVDFIINNSSSSKRGRNIRVQPTSVARRRGTYKGNHRIGAGRPPTEKSTAGRNSLLNKNKKKVVKRKHNLVQSITNNQANAKCH
ncbi:unnamed protein product [Macrosiphum euphorbiae]|uniref:SWIM-type domain-containing protein n=2 Tax=Macrosiphum euphorbiae TaxID=13131 RepID=A0AAV0YF00_9HEMI|nr:unnamed protein product [Macrosiphum euphorbiae]